MAGPWRGVLSCAEIPRRPDRLPDHLIWFKWESYATWLSGFALLVLVYYLGAELYLVDPNVLDIPVWQAILISLGSLVFGWMVMTGSARAASAMTTRD
jgi:uncharacterized membrane protein